MRTSRFATLFVPLVGVAIAGAGVAVLALWLTGVAWNSEGSTNFCATLAQWHAEQTTFLERVNDVSGSREGDGLRATHDVFARSARIALPHPVSSEETELRTTLRDVIRSEEGWLSALFLLDNASGAIVGQILLDEEAARVEMNDLLREANAGLEQTCGLASLPLY